MCDSYIGLDQVYNIDLFEVNNKIRIDASVRPVYKKYRDISDDEEIDDTIDYQKDYASEDSFDGFESYNLMRKYEQSLQKLNEEHNRVPDEQSEGSFEFDLQPEDIYDLTMF